MKRNLLVLTCLVLGALFLVGQGWAACPEHPNDNGLCDTLYVEIWPGDEEPWSFPHYARFPIRVTSDIPDASIDSVAGFVIPLCFTSTNPSANAIIDPAKNKCGTEDLGRIFHPSPYNLNNSIFRDLPSMEDPQELNWMMDLSDVPGWEWDTRILNLANGNNFWMSLVASGSQDQNFKGGSRVLLATIEFTIEDSTTICIDSCFWPPTGQLAYSRSDAVTYIPRHYLPVCQYVGPYWHSHVYFTDGVENQLHTSVGHYATDDFTVMDDGGTIEAIWATFSGAGVENVTIILNAAVLQDHKSGHVEYDVTDVCQSGGTVTIYARNNSGMIDTDDFDVTLPGNDPPYLILSDAWRALAGYTMLLEVNGVDPDGGIVGDIELEAVWYQDDSLQAPTNPPSYEPGNPGHLTWAFAHADTGVWICSFLLSDSCGAEVTDSVAIEVGMLFCGDCTGDGEINLADVVCLIGYLYRQGTPPDPLCKGDATGDGSIDVADVVVMVNYLFRGSWSPCFDCCAGG